VCSSDLADYFFDGIVADWAVLERIHQSQEQIGETRNRINSVLTHLHTLMEQTGAEKEDIRHQIETLVGSVPM